MDKLEIPQAARYAWHTPIIPTLESQRQEDLKSKTSLLHDKYQSQIQTPESLFCSRPRAVQELKDGIPHRSDSMMSGLPIWPALAFLTRGLAYISIKSSTPLFPNLCYNSPRLHSLGY